MKGRKRFHGFLSRQQEYRKATVFSYSPDGLPVKTSEKQHTMIKLDEALTVGVSFLIFHGRHIRIKP